MHFCILFFSSIDYYMFHELFFVDITERIVIVKRNTKTFCRNSPPQIDDCANLANITKMP